MLILNRKINESIIIEDNIEIKILDIVDGKIKLGIEAPKDIRILRKEVYDEVKAENEASIQSIENVLDMIRGKI
ncbi:carbon storage regulator CsrA [Alkalibaculum sp. M08DMB]|uniref:Translational regulator CsrA n=1 Tax=Alkalibaculum sporogenes TaxID=2655001 RepID=A0A6A7K5T7_9FIRM|nr:carbon storage regulator CsrA [Alkalibaculum sporogenes]MPW24770.1 carbon storage regulator CsrA [Alkalibaculum sporogenes]